MKAGIRIVLTLFVISLSLPACKYFNREDKHDEKPLARVFDKYLYPEDIEGIVPNGMTGHDSVQFVENYINNWAKNELILYKAEYNLREEQKDFEKQLEDYRNDLLKFTYHQEIMRKYLDTVVKEEAMEEYYSNNPENFELKENIVKASYIRLNKESPKLDEAREWFFSDGEGDRERIEEYALKYSNMYSFDDSSWTSFEELTRYVPLQTYNQEQFLSSNRQVTVEDSIYVYFVDIADYKIKDNTSPLPYVRETIKNIIINRRKLELIREMEKNLMRDAFENNDFETY